MSSAIDTQEENRLLDAIKRASDLVDGGLDPDAAVLKVAQDLRLTPGRIETVCRAYNTGQQAAQREANTATLAKMAAFPLANPQKVIAALYGAAKAASALPAYPRLPSPPPPSEGTFLVKAAAELLQTSAEVAPDPLYEQRRQWSKQAAAKQAAEDARRQVTALTDKLRTKIASVVRYFQSAPAGRLSFATVEQAARTYFSKMATDLMTCVHNQLRSGEKRAEDTLQVLAEPVNLTEEPFTSLRTCIKLATTIVSAKRAAHTALTAVEAAEARPAPTPNYQPSDTSLLGIRKEAGLFGGPAMGTALGTFLSRSLGGVPRSDTELVDSAQLSLEDPQHLNELRKIQANTMLTSMLTDPEDPIAGHDPDKVLREYNEISRLAPRLAEQPAALRSILQRRLQGGVQPFETKEITDIEKTLAQSKNPKEPGNAVVG